MRARRRTTALLALVQRVTKGSGMTWLVSALGIFAAALFYGDSMITPAISVLSAVEGLQIVAPDLERYVIPATLLILTVLFFIQHRGTGAVGMFFGPVMVGWSLPPVMVIVSTAMLLVLVAEVSSLTRPVASVTV